MKKVILALALFMSTLPVFSQAVYEEITNFKKERVVSFNITYDQPQEIVTKAVGNILKANAQYYVSKGNSIESLAANCTAIDSELLDMFFKIKEKNGNPTQTTLSLVVKRRGKFVDPLEEKEVAERIRTYMKGFTPEVEKMAYVAALERQQQAIADAQKKEEQLKQDKVKLEQKIADLQRQLETLKDEIVKAEENVETQKRIYKELKAKKK